MRWNKRYNDVRTKHVIHVNNCKADVLFSGLPPYHPLVAGTGFTGEQVEAAMMADSVNILKAGYNFRGMMDTVLLSQSKQLMFF